MHLPKKRFTDFAQVRKEIEDETDRETGRTKAISSVPIHLSISSPNVVNLTLVDLPGLTKVAVDGQAESIVADIENMVRAYIEKPIKIWLHLMQLRYLVKWILRGVEVNTWDLGNCTRIWTAKSPRPNSLDLSPPPWFTAVAFLCEEDHQKITASTNNHQVGLYDTSTQRRPVMFVDYRETPIKAVCPDLHGYKVYVNNY